MKFLVRLGPAPTAPEALISVRGLSGPHQDVCKKKKIKIPYSHRQGGTLMGGESMKLSALFDF